jgi:hypothetical protein
VDASSPCSGATFAGKQLVAAPWLFVDGVTTDGYVIYTDSLSFAVRAVPLAGGTPLSIGTADFNNQVYVNGAVVYFAPTYGSPLDAALSVWTATNGTHALSMHAAMGPPYTDVSADGSQIVYFDGANTAGATLTVAPTAGPTTTQPVLATGVTLSKGAAVQFSGSSVVAVYSSGSPPTTLASFGGAGYTQTVLATGVDPSFTLDTTGGRVFVSGVAGLSAYPIGGGAGTLIDPGATGVFAGMLTGSGLVLGGHGADAIYTTNGLLRRSPVSSPTPVTLSSSGVSGILRLSPDENWVLTYQNASPDYAYYASDLRLVSATAPGSDSLLWAPPTGALFGSAFTADSRFVLYFTNLTGNLDGDFMAVSTGGGAPTKVASHGWAVMATKQSKVVLADHYTAIRTGYSAIDLESVDLANPGAPSTLVSQVDPDPYLTPSSDQIVYASSCDSGPRAGIWVMPVP